MKRDLTIKNWEVDVEKRELSLEVQKFAISQPTSVISHKFIQHEEFRQKKLEKLGTPCCLAEDRR